MDLNKLTQMSRQAVTDAQALARRRSHNEVETWHLLAALLAQENGIVPGIIDKLNVTTSAVQLAVERELERLDYLIVDAVLFDTATAGQQEDAGLGWKLLVQ